MSSALFNNPQPKHWIYIIIIFAALFIVTLMNSCKTRKIEKDSSKVIDKTEQSSKVIKKDSVFGYVGKTDKLNISSKSVQSDSGLVITEKTKTTLFDSAGKVKSIIETEKILDRKRLSKNSVSHSLKQTQSNNNQIRISVSDSIGQQKKDVTVIQSNKKLDAKKESSNAWAIFGIFLVLGSVFLIWKMKY